MVPWNNSTMAPWQQGTMGWKCEKFQPECCEADFGSRIKISGYPFGRSASFFGIHLSRFVPGLKIYFFEKLSQVSRVADMVAEKMFTLLVTKSEQDGQTCCEAAFGTRIKILRYPLGRSASFFEIYLFRLVLAPKIDFFENPIAETAGAAEGG